MLDLARFLEPFKLAFQEFYRLLIIALVLPAYSAACECIFSALKLIKTHLRSTVCDSRLSNVAVLSVERVRAYAINQDGFVDEFDMITENWHFTESLHINLRVGLVLFAYTFLCSKRTLKCCNTVTPDLVYVTVITD
jgi:hypothetical protein